MQRLLSSTKSVLAVERRYCTAIGGVLLDNAFELIGGTRLQIVQFGRWLSGPPPSGQAPGSTSTDETPTLELLSTSERSLGHPAPMEGVSPGDQPVSRTSGVAISPTFANNRQMSAIRRELDELDDR